MDLHSISDTLNIVELFKQMEPLMTHKSDEMRCQATQLMLTRCESLAINDQQLDMLIGFFIQRLLDTKSNTGPLLEMLIKRRKDNHVFLSQIGDVKKYQRETRLCIYRIFDHLLEREFSINLATIVVKGVFGEKDPRNIYLAFSLIKKLLPIPECAPLRQQMFNFLDCYYPIEFEEIADKNQPRKNDIIHILDECLSLIPELAIPVVDDKLHSSYSEAQIAALRTFRVMCKYPLSEKDCNMIWESILRYSESLEEEDEFKQLLPLIIPKLTPAKRQTITKMMLQALRELPLSKQSYVAVIILQHLDCIDQCAAQFLELFSLKDLTVAQKRIEAIFQIISGKHYQNQQIVDKLFIALQSKQQNIIALSLKTLMELGAQNDPQIVEYLLNQINHQELIIQKCFVDYLSINIEKLLPQWVNSPLYVYCIPTALKIPGFRQTLENQLIDQLFNPDQYTKELLSYLDSLDTQVILNKLQLQDIHPSLRDMVRQRVKCPNLNIKQILDAPDYLLYYLVDTAEILAPQILDHITTSKFDKNTKQERTNFYEIVRVALKDQQLYQTNLVEEQFNEDGVSNRELQYILLSLHQPDILFDIVSQNPELKHLVRKQDLAKRLLAQSLDRYLISLLDEPEPGHIKYLITVHNEDSQLVDLQKEVKMILTADSSLETALKLKNPKTVAVVLQHIERLSNMLDLTLYKNAMAYMKSYLDHPKRNIRRAAQSAINTWYLNQGKYL